jgi:hypothetical protein
MELDGGFHFSILPVGRGQVNPQAQFRTSVRINLIVTAQQLCESQCSHLHPSFSRKLSMPVKCRNVRAFLRLVFGRRLAN